MQRRVKFTLSMPGVGSWNGRWSGEGRHYFLVRKLGDKKIDELKIPTSWYYRWDDGWAASIKADIVPAGDRVGKSDGFCGYEWMVDSIIGHGDIQTPEDRKRTLEHASRSPTRDKDTRDE